MGRSDKPDIGYRFVDHARYIDGFLEALGLERITFVLRDWGSALGFAWAMRHESRVRGLAFMEAILGPVPSWEEFPPQGREIFQKLRTPGVGEPMVLDHNMFVEQLLPGSVVRSLSPAEMQHYRAPFVERAARKPMLAWPREIPIAGEPADVVAVVSRYRDALCQSQLMERGHAVRALAHREDDRSKRLGKMGAEVFIGDFLKFNDVRAAMRGVRGAYFCYPIRPGILQATAYFAQAAKEAGLECVLNMSQKSAREDALSHAAQDHWPSEQVFDWSGINAAQLRPTYFAKPLPYPAPIIPPGA